MARLIEGKCVFGTLESCKYKVNYCYPPLKESKVLQLMAIGDCSIPWIPLEYFPGSSVLIEGATTYNTSQGRYSIASNIDPCSSQSKAFHTY
jgi:hypothetical protein